MHNHLSVVIITKNEEKFIKDSIESTQFADEILLLDSGSTDDTCGIADKQEMVPMSINSTLKIQYYK
jgi:glycosyltransferase involved in cell wall biosynthesis